ncbi:hypothetical protein pb186bvf_009009 [Paramecium bursaria]
MQPSFIPSLKPKSYNIQYTVEIVRKPQKQSIQISPPKQYQRSQSIRKSKKYIRESKSPFKLDFSTIQNEYHYRKLNASPNFPINTQLLIQQMKRSTLPGRTETYTMCKNRVLSQQFGQHRGYSID